MEINEIVDDRMKYRGVNQTELCKECGLTIQNFNAFIKGKRTLPMESLVRVMALLTLYYKKEGENPISPADIEEKLVSLAKGCGKKITEIAQEANISASTLSCIINGKREMSAKAADALTEYFGYQVVSL